VRAFPVQVAAPTASKEAEPGVHPVPRDSVGPRVARRRPVLGQGPVALRATLEPEFTSHPRHGVAHRPELVGEMKARQEDRSRGRPGEGPVACEEDSVLGSQASKDRRVIRVPGILGVASHEPKVAGQPADHLVREESGF